MAQSGGRDKRGVSNTRFFAPFMAIFLLFVGVAGGLLAYCASVQNDLARQQASMAVDQSMERIGARLRALAVEYSIWNEQSLRGLLSDEPNAAKRRLGLWLFQKHGIPVSFLIGPDGRVRVALVEGRTVEMDPQPSLSSGLPALLAQIERSGGEASGRAIGLLSIDSTVDIVAATTLSIPGDASTATSGDGRAALLIGAPLRRELRNELGASPLLGDLDVLPADAEAPRGVLSGRALASPDGTTVGLLVWRPARPGDTLLFRLGPPLALVLLVVGGLLWWMANRLRAANTVMAERAEALAKANEDLAANAGMLEVVFDAIDHGVSVWDRDLKLVGWNDNFRRVVGYPRSLLRVGVEAVELLHYRAMRGDFGDRDPAATVAAELKRLRFSGSYNFEEVTADGTVLEVRQHELETGGLVRSYLDITERRRAEALLQASEARYRAVVENQREFIVRMTPDRTCTFVNEAMCRFLQRRREELIGQREFEPIDPLDRTAVERELARITPDSPTLTLAYRVDKADGELGWVEWTYRAILDESRQVAEIQGVGRDISELRAAQEQALHLAKLASLGQVVAGLAHEIAQPLNALSMASENALMAHDTEGDEAIDYMREKLETVRLQGERMAKIVDHLRRFNRADLTGLEEVELALVVRSALMLSKNQIALDKIELLDEVPGSSRRIRGRPFEIEQVILNFITNARDAIIENSPPPAPDRTGPRGRIRVELIDRPGRSNLRIRISDTGGGIPEAHLSRIFDPFFTTKELGKGMGLGLSICYRAIAGMGGHINVWNIEGGAQFEILLPAIEDGGIEKVAQPSAEGASQ
ncbi:PAS domain S-box-containing protein [Tistlia consotensis]|uniref:histidine kinase n=1 Tax=Tistlia consotensis USBA 355 TaxID=560819 RepID=A0A1Y6CFD1_9PROT|nr:PAS-domain containing protein [Tistlia consotensis]SMF60618.1 PAS domain S-box-containing protein [Tistlia consotensis USBA 355]SNR93135.1 PAS domain S-box-containing protein [Tistlia consotensis]